MPDFNENSLIYPFKLGSNSRDWLLWFFVMVTICFKDKVPKQVVKTWYEDK